MVIRSKFAGRCTVCRGPVAVGELVSWERGQGSKHADVTVCAAVKAAPAQAAVEANLAPVAAFLAGARERGLKFPKARFLAPGGGEFRLSVAGDSSKYPGCIQVKLDGEWLGRVTVAGEVAGPLANRPELVAALRVIAAGPAAAATAYGALTSRCSFCDQALSDEGSVEVGYGPICAKRYGLAHVAKGSRNLVAAGLVSHSPAVKPPTVTDSYGDTWYGVDDTDEYFDREPTLFGDGFDDDHSGM
jgi:hypothetical protein